MDPRLLAPVTSLRGTDVHDPGDAEPVGQHAESCAPRASYVPASYPAACDPEVVLALAEGARREGHRFHVGTIRSADSDYVGGGRPSVAGYFQPWHEQLAETWVKAGVLSGDRESAAIVTMARLFGRRGGSICSVADNLATGAAFSSGAGHQAAIVAALEGMAILAQMDRQRDADGLSLWLPSLGPLLDHADDGEPTEAAGMRAERLEAERTEADGAVR
ncbi:MAG: hypothetical protein ACK5LS_07685 [Propioniciclava sp.]